MTNESYNQMYQPELTDSGSDSSSESDGAASGSSAGGNDAYQSKAPFASSSALPGTGPRGAKRKSEPKPKKARPPKPILGMMPSGPPQKLEEGMHVCVTCGRTDSPEWRKGPLGPKTLCNVSRLGTRLTFRLVVSAGPSATRRLQQDANASQQERRKRRKRQRQQQPHRPKLKLKFMLKRTRICTLTTVTVIHRLVQMYTGSLTTS